MAHELRHIDISKLPELLDIAREVQRSQQASVLQGDGGNLALVIPLPQTRRPRPIREQLIEAQIWADTGVVNPNDLWAGYDPDQVQQALRQSAGALTGVDRDELMREIEEPKASRSSSGASI
jgi:hypothetical protein